MTVTCSGGCAPAILPITRRRPNFAPQCAARGPSAWCLASEPRLAAQSCSGKSGGALCASVSTTRMPRAAIVGIAGQELAANEAALFRALPPAGVILFGRNIVEPGQLAALIASLRDVLPESAVLMIDQEGGRVARLRPPRWRAHPSA